MGIVDNIRNFFNKPAPTPNAHYGNGEYRTLYVDSFDGEKNLGELGPAIDYRLDFQLLRIRSHQAYLENEIAKTVLDRFTIWMVSKGLKLQSEPVELLIKEKLKDGFANNVEARFNLWANSECSDYTYQSNLHAIAQEAFKSAKIGGDVLVVLRYENNQVNVQLIDGAHVSTPLGQIGNAKIINGVEVDEKKKHVAYYVKTKDLSHKKIKAYNKAGFRTAFLVYGNKHRIDNLRGLPLIAVSLESMKKLERYKEATVAGAEERAKIVYQIIHDNNSTGQSPLAKRLVNSVNTNRGSEIPVDEQGKQLADKFAVTTNKTAFNMPIGSKIEGLNAQQEVAYAEFYSSNADSICSSVGIPPNVAFSIYNDSFSASRAATKDWEHTITVERADFTTQFYKRIYTFWLHTEILKNNIQVPGYLKAFHAKDKMTIEAYRNARFIGQMFPHIDPVKEVNAERLKLGNLASDIPLTTVESATEMLNGGDAKSNMAKFKTELQQFGETSTAD